MVRMVRLQAHTLRFSLLVFVSIAALGQSSAKRQALELLHKAEPTAQWDEKIAVTADVTCHGKSDTIAVGHKGEKVWVGIVPGDDSKRASRPIIFEFYVGKNSQDSFCAIPVRIAVGPLNCEGPYGRLEECKPVKGCQEFAVIDDACDSFHFYWDSVRKRLDWWRL